MQIERFLGRHADFVAVPASALLAELCPGGAAAIAAPGEGPYLALSPARHGTDGFFSAVLERRA